MSHHIRQIAAGTLAAAGIGLIGGAFVPRAHADAWDKKTIVTVSEPIIAGNKVLDPGVYVWKLMDSPSNRHILQIFDKGEQHLETTILTIPDYRVNPAEHTEFAFYETPAGVPRAVHTWYYPGENAGENLPYPKKLVAQLASAAPAPVPMSTPEPAPTPQPEAQPESQPAAPAPIAEPEPAPVPEPAPAPAQPQAAAQSAPARAEPVTLPHTASFNPLIGLFGVMSLSLAGLVTAANKKA